MATPVTRSPFENKTKGKRTQENDTSHRKEDPTDCEASHPVKVASPATFLIQHHQEMVCKLEKMIDANSALRGANTLRSSASYLQNENNTNQQSLYTDTQF
jgi:hypothetical protein